MKDWVWIKLASPVGQVVSSFSMILTSRWLDHVWDECEENWGMLAIFSVHDNQLETSQSPNTNLKTAIPHMPGSRYNLLNIFLYKHIVQNWNLHIVLLT